MLLLHLFMGIINYMHCLNVDAYNVIYPIKTVGFSV